MLDYFGVFILGCCIGYMLDCWNPANASIKCYLLAAVGMLLTGSVLYGLMRVMNVDPLWSVSKAEKFCSFPERIRHKHNVMAVFVRAASALLG
jgi:glucose-6-phosphatase